MRWKAQNKYKGSVKRVTHPANDLPEEEPRELREDEGNGCGEIEEHRSALAQDTEDDVRHNDEVQQGGSNENVKFQSRLDSSLSKDVHARPDAREDEDGNVVKVTRRVGRSEGRGKAQRRVKRDISCRDEESEREYAEGLYQWNGM